MYSEKPNLHQRQKRHQPGQLRTVALDTTFRCNLNCPHCYAFPFINKVEAIDMELLKPALEEFYGMGVFHYVLQGGEAITDMPRLREIIPHLHPEETYLNVISNGWEMDRKIIQELKDLQVDKITFSLDSGIPEEHDQGRREGCYDRVIKAIGDVRDSGMLVGLSTVITHQSLHTPSFEKVYEVAKQEQVRLHLQIAEPVGNWEGNQEVLLTEEDTLYTRRLYDESALLPNGQKILHRDLYLEDGECCPAGTEFLSLTADGELFTCNFLQFTLGNIRDHSVREMRDMVLQSPWFSERHNRCLAGEHQEFMELFMFPNKGCPKPMNATEVFGLKRCSESCTCVK
ncbi:MAG: radical SAM/SPASM domain-containing protein, partial [Limisphaerales bacterium]